MLAYDYPIVGAFMTMFWFFIWILWILLLFKIFADIFRRHDMGGWGKAAWVILVLILPFLGVFIYLIVHGHDMGRRDIEAAQAQEQAFRTYVQQTAGSGNSSVD